MNFKSLKRKVKYAFFIPRGVTKTPKVQGSVISDLFCIRNDSGWETHFELLNIEGLINGDNSADSKSEAEIVFLIVMGIRLAQK